jgi:ribose 5-phosphate isomerase A
MRLKDQERLLMLAEAAADLVTSGMHVGLGTGSTAAAVVRALGKRVASGLEIIGVATSHETEVLARELGITLTTLDAVERLDIGLDGADEIDPHLNAIKGRGGALLIEKLVALACDQFVLVASTEKDVRHLGERMPLPVEVVSFGWPGTAGRLAALGIESQLRLSPSAVALPLTTDNGGYILDCHTGPISDPVALGAAIKGTTGVVDHGLFLGIATEALQVNPDGQIVRRERKHA